MSGVFQAKIMNLCIYVCLCSYCCFFNLMISLFSQCCLFDNKDHNDVAFIHFCFVFFVFDFWILSRDLNQVTKAVSPLKKKELPKPVVIRIGIYLTVKYFKLLQNPLKWKSNRIFQVCHDFLKKKTLVKEFQFFISWEV